MKSVHYYQSQLFGAWLFASLNFNPPAQTRPSSPLRLQFNKVRRSYPANTVLELLAFLVDSNLNCLNQFGADLPTQT
jgi:hypothetical protein